MLYHARQLLGNVQDDGAEGFILDLRNNPVSAPCYCVMRECFPKHSGPEPQPESLATCLFAFIHPSAGRCCCTPCHETEQTLHPFTLFSATTDKSWVLCKRLLKSRIQQLHCQGAGSDTGFHTGRPGQSGHGHCPLVAAGAL